MNVRFDSEGCFRWEGNGLNPFEEPPIPPTPWMLIAKHRDKVIHMIGRLPRGLKGSRRIVQRRVCSWKHLMTRKHLPLSMQHSWLVGLFLVANKSIFFGWRLAQVSWIEECDPCQLKLIWVRETPARIVRIGYGPARLRDFIRLAWFYLVSRAV